MKTWESHIVKRWRNGRTAPIRSEEHTSELQSQSNLVCRLLLEKKKHNDIAASALAAGRVYVAEGGDGASPVAVWGTGRARHAASDVVGLKRFTRARMAAPAQAT